MSENRDTEHPLNEAFEYACVMGMGDASRYILVAITKIGAVRNLAARYDLKYDAEKLNEVIKALGEVFELLADSVVLTPEERKAVDLELRKYNASNN